jgi:hypothetical protein
VVQHWVPQHVVVELHVCPPLRHGGVVHLPLPQYESGSVHLVPHPPQLVGSFCSLTHDPLQHCVNWSQAGLHPGPPEELPEPLPPPLLDPLELPELPPDEEPLLLPPSLPPLLLPPSTEASSPPPPPIVLVAPPQRTRMTTMDKRPAEPTK